MKDCQPRILYLENIFRNLYSDLVLCSLIFVKKKGGGEIQTFSDKQKQNLLFIDQT